MTEKHKARIELVAGLTMLSVAAYFAIANKSDWDDAYQAKLQHCMVYLPAMTDIKLRHWCELQSKRLP